MTLARSVANFYLHVFYLFTTTRGGENGADIVPLLVAMYPYLVEACEQEFKDKGNDSILLIMSTKTTASEVLRRTARKAGIPIQTIHRIHPDLALVFCKNQFTLTVRLDTCLDSIRIGSNLTASDLKINWIPTIKFTNFENRKINNGDEATFTVFLQENKLEKVDEYLGEIISKETRNEVCRALNGRRTELLPYYRKSHALGQVMNTPDRELAIQRYIYPDPEQAPRARAARFPRIEAGAQWNHSGDDHTG